MTIDSSSKINSPEWEAATQLARRGYDEFSRAKVAAQFGSLPSEEVQAKAFFFSLLARGAFSSEQEAIDHANQFAAEATFPHRAVGVKLAPKQPVSFEIAA